MTPLMSFQLTFEEINSLNPFGLIQFSLSKKDDGNYLCLWTSAKYQIHCSYVQNNELGKYYPTIQSKDTFIIKGYLIQEYIIKIYLIQEYIIKV